MPTIPAGTKVLVTGANGYIATWVAQNLLEMGYSVRGTVRSVEKGEHLKSRFTSYGEKFEVVIVNDFSEEGAFDEVVKEVDAIEHIASPCYINLGAPQDIIKPAVQGTLGILGSAKKFGTSVKRVVITSSVATIITTHTEYRIFNEQDWNEDSERIVKEQGKDAPPRHKYRVSKTLAERAAWDFYNTHQSEIGWDLVVLIPSFVFGPPIHEIPTVSSLNSSLKQWHDIVVAGIPQSSEALALTPGWVDVRDLAKAHVCSLKSELAGGERIIISSSAFTWQQWLDVANSLNPQPYTFRPLPVNVPKPEKLMIGFDTTKEKSILKMQFRSVEESTRDMLVYFDERRW